MTELSAARSTSGVLSEVGRPVRIAHLYSTTPWLAFFLEECLECRQGQCPSNCPPITLRGHQAPDVSPREPL